MSFTSLEFFLFLPTVLIIYQFLPSKYRYIHLLISSYLFYACNNVRLLLLIVLTTLVTYLCAITMEKVKTKARKKMAVLCALTVCLGILWIFKYLNFSLNLVSSLSGFFGFPVSFRNFSIILPMGISFYVFQTMSYTLDVYHGKMKAERHLGYYALFVVFFPQLVAGPIERPEDLLPQLKKACPIQKNNLLEGFCYFIHGYAKKVLIADYVAGFVDTAYQNIAAAGGSALFAATALFAIQIYCDFSGYSDIALGCARFLGIRLTENFKNPYAAISIRDFWHRWHRSLTRWFTDYVYIPLGGSRQGLLRHCRNIFLTFLVSGLWHGANLTFLCWGGIHGLYLMIETLWNHRKWHPTFGSNRTAKKFVVPLQRISTFFLVCFAWIFFRSPSLTDALFIIGQIICNPCLNQLLPSLGLTTSKLVLLCLILLTLPVVENLPSMILAHDEEQAFPKQSLRMCLYFLLILCIFLCRFMILTERGSTNFIYFQF